MSAGAPQSLYLAAAALRLVLFVAFPQLPDLLTGRVEISTPVTSFKRCTLERSVGFGEMMEEG